jgi:hypothetical protein
VRVSILEGYYPSIAGFLHDKTDSDPGFMQRLLTAIKSDDYGASHEFFDQLEQEVKDWSARREKKGRR